MKRLKVDIEIMVPDQITENMIALKFDNLESELYEHLDGEIGDDDEVEVTLVHCYET